MENLQIFIHSNLDAEDCERPSTFLLPFVKISCTECCSVAIICLEDCTGDIRDASEIDNVERAKIHNLHSPATRILNAYKHQFPLDNFDKIRDFIIDNFDMNANFEMNEMEQISNALNQINLKDDSKQKYILEWLRKTYNHQVTPDFCLNTYSWFCKSIVLSLSPSTPGITCTPSTPMFPKRSENASDNCSPLQT